MKLCGLVLTVFALVAMFGLSDANTVRPTTKPTANKVNLKPTLKPALKPSLKPALKPILKSTLKPVINTPAVTVPTAVAAPIAVQTQNPCTEIKMCSEFSQTIWATDGVTCKALRNGCYLFNENCFNLSQNKSALRVVSKEDCIPFCKNCNGDYEILPVCGQIGEQRRVFINPCSMENHSCLTGETYLPAPSSEYCGFEVESDLRPF